MGSEHRACVFVINYYINCMYFIHLGQTTSNIRVTYITFFFFFNEYLRIAEYVVRVVYHVFMKYTRKVIYSCFFFFLL